MAPAWKIFHETLGPMLHLPAPGLRHLSHQIFVHTARIKDAAPAYIQPGVYYAGTDRPGIIWRKIERIVHEVKAGKPSFHPFGKPSDEDSRRAFANKTTLNSLRGAIAASYRTPPSGLNRRPKILSFIEGSGEEDKVKVSFIFCCARQGMGVRCS